MSDNLKNISHFYGTPPGLLIQVISYHGGGHNLFFAGDEFSELESSWIRWAEDVFGNLGELDDIGHDALGEFMIDCVNQLDGHEEMTLYKITDPSGTVFCNGDIQTFDSLWERASLDHSNQTNFGMKM